MANTLKHSFLNTIRGLLSGLLTGVTITIFANSVDYATVFNAEHRFLLLLLPLGALGTCFLYRRFGKEYRRVTSIAIDRINDEASTLADSQKVEVSPKMGVIAYLNGMISHFLGASVGKEGVGVQIGLASSEMISRCERKLFRSDNSDTYLMCGAAAAFSTLFSAPIAGSLFGINFASPTRSRIESYLPCIISAFSSSMLGNAIGIHILSIPEFTPLEFTLPNAFVVFMGALLLGLITRLAVFLFEWFQETPLRIMPKNDYLKVLAPAIFLVIVTFTLYAFNGNYDYNGLGGFLIGEAILGERGIADAVFKVLLIFLSISAGFQGGEVVPLMILGSSLSAPFAGMLGLPVGPFAALGAIAMVSGGTNLPLVCFALGLELFGYTEPALLFIACITSFVASGKMGILSHQKM